MNIDDEILAKLDTLVKLQALAVISDLSTNKEKILYLSEAGIGPKDIASIVGTTSNSVSVLLSKERKKKKNANN